jgi:hypothetical protein
MSTLNVDALVGVSSANAITVRGEGSATTSLQQGLAKVWISDETLVATSNHTEDSFNVGSVTDVGSGVAQVNNTNNMSNTGYSSHTQHTINGDVMDTPKTVANTASERTNFFRSSTSATVDQAFAMTIFGDLA